MAQEESHPIRSILCGTLVGVGLTYAYVRFGYSLPGVLQVGKKVSAEAVVATAEIDLFDPHAPSENRYRALAVVVSQRPDMFLEIDEAIGHPIFEEVVRRKAVREAKLIKGGVTAYDEVLKRPALRALQERKFRTRDTEELRRWMLLSDIDRKELLAGYLRRHFPTATADDKIALVLNVYRDGLRPPGTGESTESEAERTDPAATASGPTPSELR